MANKYQLRRRELKGARGRSENPFASPRSGGGTEPSGDTYTPPLPLDRRWMTFALSLGLVVLITLLYGQTASHEFTVCDDNVYIYDKPQIVSGVTWDHVVWAFSDAHEGNWHPLTWISHMLDWQLFSQGSWEQDNLRYKTSWPGGHHLVSMAIHCANAVLLFLALRLMTGALWPSFVVAVLFGVHPLRVESVAWAAERKDVLCGLFWMASMVAYALYARRRPIRATSFFTASGITAILCILFVRLLVLRTAPGQPDTTPEPFTIPWMIIIGLGVAGAIAVESLHSTSLLTQAAEVGSYLLITVLFALGLMSKSMIVTLPCVFLLLDIWPLGRWKKALQRAAPEAPWQAFLAGGWLVLEKIPWFLLAYLDSRYTIYGQEKGVALNSLEGLPMGPRILNAVVAFGEYLRQMVWPTGLAPFYYHPHMIPGGWTSAFETQVVVFGVLLTLITALSVAALIKNLNWRWPSLTVGWFCYLYALVPIVALLQTWTCQFKRRIAPTSSSDLMLAICADAISILAERRNVIFAYSLLLLALASVAVVATIKKWRWPALALGWLWFLGILTPVVGYFQGWKTEFVSRLILHGVVLALITALFVAAILKKWQWPWLAAGWFWYLGALVPLLGFLDQWKNLLHAEFVLYAAVLSPLVAGAVAALSKNWRCSFLTVGWFWYLGALVPVIGIIQVGTQARADRYTYLPMIGAYLMIAWLLKEVADRWPKTRLVLAVSAAVVLAGLCAVTFRQVSYWVNSYRIFDHAVQVTERNYFAFNHLGIAYDKDAKTMQSASDPQAAESLFDHVSETFRGPPKIHDNSPKHPPLPGDSMENFTAAVKKLDRMQKSELLFDYSADNFQAAIDIKPDYDFGNNNLGVYYAHRGGPEDLKLAEKYFRGALMSNSRYADAFNNLGIVLAGQGADAQRRLEEAIAQHKIDEAQRTFDEAERKFGDAIKCHLLGLAIFDHRASDHNNLCRVFLKRHDLYIHKGETAKAQADLASALSENVNALRCDPNFLPAWLTLMDIRFEQKNFDEAGKCVQRMMAIDPRSPITMGKQYQLAAKYIDLKRPDDAIALLEPILNVSTSAPEVYNALGIAYVQKSDLKRALENFVQVKRLIPNSPSPEDRIREIQQQLVNPPK